MRRQLEINERYTSRARMAVVRTSDVQDITLAGIPYFSLSFHGPPFSIGILKIHIVLSAMCLTSSLPACLVVCLAVGACISRPLVYSHPWSTSALFVVA